MAAKPVKRHARQSDPGSRLLVVLLVVSSVEWMRYYQGVAKTAKEAKVGKLLSTQPFSYHAEASSISSAGGDAGRDSSQVIAARLWQRATESISVDDITRTAQCGLSSSMSLLRLQTALSY